MKNLSIMSESIELSSFRATAAKDNDIEEYHEIDLNEFVEAPLMSPSAPAPSPKTFDENDFFTQQDVKTSKKNTLKKKKGKKKDKPSNLMDIINSELASVTVPVQENVVTFVDYPTEQRNSYVITTSRQQGDIRRTSLLDSEQGWVQKETAKLNPTFPKILENVATEQFDLPVQYVKPVMHKDVIVDNKNEEQTETRFLDIEIKDMKFKHHHQFSLEKMLTVKLNILYNEYKAIKTSLKDLEKEIKILRETRDTVKQEFESISPNKKQDIRFDPTVRKYTGQLLALKEKFIKTLEMEKEIIHKICILWCDIEMVREKTGRTETPEVITLSKKSMPEENYDQEWNETFNREFSDMLDKVEYEYVNKYLEYKEVKYTQNLDDSAKRRITKPKLVIDEDELKEEVEEIVNNIVSKDQIEVNLDMDETHISEKVKLEKLTIKHKYFFEVYVDELYVCETEHFTCKTDKIPDVEFSEAISVQILPKNSTVSLVLSENNREVSTLRINLADIKSNYANAEFLTKDFVYNELVEPNNKHVGSGHNIKEIASQNKVRLKSSNIFKGNLYTSCDINIKMGWNDKNKNNTEAIKSSMEVGRQLKRLIHGIDKPTTEGLMDIIKKIYNKDVTNDEEVRNTIRNLAKMEVKPEDTFAMDENSPDFIRLKLLHLRNNGGMSNVQSKRIPLHASQISTELLNCLQRSKETDFDVQYFQDKSLEMEPIEVQRFIGSKYVQKLNQNMLKNLNEHLLRKTHKDVVRDFKDLSLRTLFTNSTNLTLANMSSSTKQQMLTEAFHQEQEIKVTVLRAFNLPDRSAALEEGDEDEIAGYKVRPLRPFVRVSYNGAHTQTTAAIGCHPSWSQTVNIRAKPSPLSNIQINVFDEHKATVPDGSDDDSGRTVHYRFTTRWLGALQIPLYTVLTLGKLRGTFKLTTPPMLFGYENLMQPRDSTHTLIPAIAQLMKKETSFISLNITTTLSHLGGLHGYNQPIPNFQEDYLINHLNNFVTEYTNDFPSRNISLTFIDSSGKNKCVTQFLQPIPSPDSESFPKNPKLRSESAMSKSSGVSKSSSSKSSGKRRSEDKGIYEERESFYSTMSFKGGENQLDKVMVACARYVSMIPAYEVGETHTVTLMGAELLKVLFGSPLDHTILLASYFLYLGIRCWIAVGLGLPRGHSSYVLTKYDLGSHRITLQSDPMKSKGFLSKNEGCIWYVHDAVSGERSELRDVGCPLKTVDFIFDNENIWVNVQCSLDCQSVSFDLKKSAEWQTVFDKSVFVMKHPPLTDPGLYANAGDVERLRTALELKIKDKVQKWRTHMKTIWNRYCSSLLKETLIHWEYWAFNPTTDPKPMLSQRLKQLMATYKMFGCPLNMPYVNTKSVVSTVKSTGVYSVADPNVEFGLAVEIFAYPNNVLSVWVFLASITRV